MYTSQEFEERYKKFTNAELFEILQNPSHYQPTALTAAKSEFAARRLSEAEINEAAQFLLAKKEKNDKQERRNEEIKKKLIGAGNIIHDTINPIQEGGFTPEKLTRLVSVIITVLFLFKVISNSHFLFFILKGDSGISFGYTLVLFPILVELIAIIFFWLRKQIGWILLASVCSYSLIETFYGLYYSVSRDLNKEKFAYLFNTPSPVIYITTILFYLGIILTLNLQGVKEIYGINKNKMQSSIVLGALTGIIFLTLSS